MQTLPGLNFSGFAKEIVTSRPNHLLRRWDSRSNWYSGIAQADTDLLSSSSSRSDAWKVRDMGQLVDAAGGKCKW
jgi:hypothetical protein